MRARHGLRVRGRRRSPTRRRSFYHNLGFEVAVHVQHRTAPTGRRPRYEQFITDAARRVRRRIPEHSAADARTATTASRGATGARQPEVEAAHGIRLDTNYYYWPASWIQDRPGMFTGSGMPMRFAKLDGTMIDCYQAATQMTGRVGRDVPGDPRPRCSTARTGPRATTVCSPPTCTSIPRRTPARTPSSPRRRRAACRSCRPSRCSTWLDGRNGSSFGDRVERERDLSFTVAAGAGAQQPAGDGAGVDCGRDAGGADARRLAGRVHDRDHQGHQVRVLPGRGRQLRRHVRRRHDAARHHRRHRHAARRRHGRRSPGTRTRRPTRAWTTEPRRVR